MLGVRKIGQFRGCRTLLVLHGKKHKTFKLSMKNHCIEDDPEYSTYVEDVKDPINFVKIFIQYNTKFLPHPDSGIKLPKNGRFFFVKLLTRF